MAKAKIKKIENKVVGQVPLIELPDNTIFFLAQEAGTLKDGRGKVVGRYGATIDGSIYLILKGKNYKVSVFDAIETLNQVITKEPTTVKSKLS